MALTSKQTAFADTYLELLDAEVVEAEAFRQAKSFAQYADTTVRSDILSDEMLTYIQAYYNRAMIIRMAKASRKMDDLLDEPDSKGAAVLLGTVNSVFDRGGVIKKESKEITVKAPTGVVAMPPKVELDPEV